jgi:hypothetical protein
MALNYNGASANLSLNYNQISNSATYQPDVYNNNLSPQSEIRSSIVDGPTDHQN